jgi:hypothetical protein
MVLSMCVLGVTLFAFWVAFSTHDVAKAIDEDWLGRHACPAAQNPTLATKFTPASNRPDEDQLLQLRLDSFQNHDPFIRSPFGRSSNSGKGQNEDVDQFKLHYFIEVRRTILEMEARRPLRYPVYGLYLGPLENDEHTGVLHIPRGCEISTHSPKFAHDCGRIDALLWYASHAIYAINSTKIVKSSF